jgi:ubiquinone/menaquinone biosynthesis C-methylase UbiE
MPLFIGFIPTPEDEVCSFFDLSPVSSNDVVYDLGSGDGRLLFAALERGAGKAVGIELNPWEVAKAREKAVSKGWQEKITFLESDIMEVNLSPATVILCYLFTTASRALKSKFEAELKPGARVVMESFPIPGWKPVVMMPSGYKQFYLYIMPPQITVEPAGDQADYSEFEWLMAQGGYNVMSHSEYPFIT